MSTYRYNEKGIKSLNSSTIHLPKLGKPNNCQSTIKKKRSQGNHTSHPEILEVYREIKTVLFSKKDKSDQLTTIEHKFNELICSITSFKVQYSLRICLIEIVISFGDIQKAMHYLSLLRNDIAVCGTYPMLMDIYKNCAFCLKKLERFTESLYYYKRMMKVAWDISNKEYERNGFDLLGMGYFYLGDMENANICHKLVKEGYGVDSPNRGIYDATKIDIIVELKRSEFDIKRKTDIDKPRTLDTPINEYYLQAKYIEDNKIPFNIQDSQIIREEYRCH